MARRPDDEMDLGDALPPGMPTPRRSGPVKPAQPRAQPAGKTGRAKSGSGGGASKSSPPPAAPAAPDLGTLPTENPYAGDKRVQMGHRVLESIPAQVAALSEELVEAGYGQRQVSQAELIQAVLHFYMPRSADDARDLVQRWALLKAAPPIRR